MKKKKKSFRYKYLIMSILFFVIFAFGMEYHRTFWTWIALLNSGLFAILYLNDKEISDAVKIMDRLKFDLATINGAVKHMEENYDKYEKEKLKRIMDDLLLEGEEIIGTNGLRFNGTHEEKIKQVFKRHGIIYEIPF
jgi:metallophosphoesterase superfamily enzyme